METMKTLRILGKRGRVTVPQEVRDEIGLERGDVVSFAVLDEDSVLVKKERLCENCVTETAGTGDAFCKAGGIGAGRVRVFDRSNPTPAL